MASWRSNSRLTHRGACLALLVLSSVCPADPALTKPAAVALNQSVSLVEGSTSADSSYRQDAPDSEVARPTRGEDAAFLGQQEVPGHSRLLRRRDAEATLGRSPDESTPWYRTGIGSLGVVLGLMGGAFWAIRRWFPSMRVGDSSIVKVVGRAAISPKHNVALLRFGRRFLLVGIAGERMSTLAEVNDAEEVAELAARAGGEAVFEGFLGREVIAYGAESEEEAAEAVEDRMAFDRPHRASLHVSALTQLKNRLRSLQSK